MVEGARKLIALGLAEEDAAKLKAALFVLDKQLVGMAESYGPLLFDVALSQVRSIVKYLREGALPAGPLYEAATAWLLENGGEA